MSDLISRSDAIGAVKEERFPIDSDYAEGFMAALDKVEWILKEWLPSAQPETHEERTETHACDCIERQAAIDSICRTVCDNPEICESPCDEIKVLEIMPSAQHELPEWAQKIEEYRQNAPSYVQNPLAWALYQVWKEYNERLVHQRGKEN